LMGLSGNAGFWPAISAMFLPGGTLPVLQCWPGLNVNRL